VPLLGGAEFPSNTMWHTSMPNGILIQPAVWPGILVNGTIACSAKCRYVYISYSDGDFDGFRPALMG